MAYSDKWKREPVFVRNFDGELCVGFVEKTDPNDNKKFIADGLEESEDSGLAALAEKFKGEK